MERGIGAEWFLRAWANSQVYILSSLCDLGHVFKTQYYHIYSESVIVPTAQGCWKGWNVYIWFRNSPCQSRNLTKVSYLGDGIFLTLNFQKKGIMGYLFVWSTYPKSFKEILTREEVLYSLHWLTNYFNSFAGILEASRTHQIPHCPIYPGWPHIFCPIFPLLSRYMTLS